MRLYQKSVIPHLTQNPLEKNANYQGIGGLVCNDRLIKVKNDKNK